MRWFPDTPGFIVGCGLLAYNGGTIILCWVFSQLVNGAGIVHALYLTAAILTIPSIFPALFLSFPPPVTAEGSQEAEGIHTDSSTSLESVYLIDEIQPNTNTNTNTNAWHSVQTLSSSRDFWLYVSVILSTGAPYAMLPYFFKLGTVFGLSEDAQMVSFQLVGAFGTALALVSGILIDALAAPRRHKSGAKRLLFYALVLQFFLFALLSFGERSPTWVFVCVCLLVVLTNSHYGCAAVLARDAFGPAKAALAFGVGGGLSIGTGEGLSVQIVALFERIARSRGVTDVSKGTYVGCYVVYLLWTVIGVASVKSIRMWGEEEGRREGRVVCGDLSGDGDGDGDEEMAVVATCRSESAGNEWCALSSSPCSSSSSGKSIDLL